ncbi:hypothetical protein A3L09_10750 (plasmid) [Thermococcus profundus]|uniref:Uncharacterized protein n=1 Tax=Thermococcus profundus TaxID=49899 RepID=A0A2Z2ME76_THEPR|nr:hypothetical protein [Thermococcus profundus]ASJ03829.1 hypothetical protein A3L09_10750 [Thermococcus profundus]
MEEFGPFPAWVRGIIFRNRTSKKTTEKVRIFMEMPLIAINLLEDKNTNPHKVIEEFIKEYSHPRGKRLKDLSKLKLPYVKEFYDFKTKTAIFVPVWAEKQPSDAFKIRPPLRKVKITINNTPVTVPLVMIDITNMTKSLLTFHLDFLPSGEVLKWVLLQIMSSMITDEEEPPARIPLAEVPLVVCPEENKIRVDMSNLVDRLGEILSPENTEGTPIDEYRVSIEDLLKDEALIQQLKKEAGL